MAAAKSTFLSNMSHELRNPLAGIVGYSELLGRQSGLTEIQRKYVTRLQDASAALLTTINEVLDFSRLEAGEVKIQPRPMDPVLLARQILQMFEPQMDRKALSHQLDFAPPPGLLLADETRLRQILTNLVGNAVKFTEHGGIVVRCRYDAAAQRLRFEVEDTGPGIPTDRQADLFQRYSQVDTSNRSFGGTGLGLAICRGLAEAMQGEVGVISEPGQGSCFWFQVPCVRATEESEQSEDSDLSAPEDLTDLRLLVVDDDQVNREISASTSFLRALSSIDLLHCSGPSGHLQGLSL